MSNLTNEGGGSLQRLIPTLSQSYMYDMSCSLYSSGVMVTKERSESRKSVWNEKEVGKNEIHAFYIRLLVELSSGRGA